MWLIIVLLCLPFLSLTAQAATYWVNQSASGQHCVNSASDPGAGSSSQTINQGVSCMSGGDEVIIHAGTYTESLGGFATAVPAGSSGNPTVVRSVQGEVVWVHGNIQLHGAWTVFDGINVSNLGAEVNGSPTCIDVQDDHITLQNLEVGYCADQGVAGHNIPGQSANNTTLINLTIHHAGFKPDGTYVCNVGQPAGQHGFCHATYFGGDTPGDSVTGLVVRGGRIHDNDGYGLHNNAPGSVTDGVTFYNQGYSGIIHRGGSNTAVYNSVFYNNGTISGSPVGGIWGGGGSDSVIYNNTFYQNAVAITMTNSVNGSVRNNIFWQNGQDFNGDPGGTVSHNLTSDPHFVNASLKDFRLQADSDAINAGVDLAFLFTTDLEGNTRVSPFDIGAYEFGGVIEPPQPVGLVGEWKLDEGSLTTAANTAAATLGTQDGTLNSVGWTTPGIIGAAGLSTNGARWVTITPSATMRAITDAFGLSGWWRGTGAGGGAFGCDLFSDGDSRVARMETDGKLSCLFYHGAGWRVVTAGSGNLLDGNSHHWSCSLDSGGDGLRARVDNASVGQLATSNTVSFTLGPQAFIGRHGNGGTDYHCGTGTIDNVYVFDQFITNEGNTNLFQEYIPLGGVSGIHVQWRADDPPTTIQGSLDTPITWTIGNTLIQEWYISNNSGSQVVAHYPQFCSRNGGAYTQVTNTSQSTIGVQVATSANANMGDSVTPAQNFGLTPVDGRSVVDTVAESLTTLPHGGVTAWRYYLSFGGVAQANDTYRCRPYKPFTAPAVLDHYFDDVATSIPLITLQSPVTVGSGVKSGGAHPGGKQQ
jgi:parallel beta-helix repeat protein